MELIFIAVGLMVLIFLAGFFMGRRNYYSCADDLENLRDILFEEEGNNYADRD